MNKGVSPEWEAAAAASEATLSEPGPLDVVKRGGLTSLPLLQFIPALSPRFGIPYHLADWCGLLERAVSEPIRALCTVPIRHYKTWTTLHGIVWQLLRVPDLRVVLLTHDFERANAIGKDLRQLAEAAGCGPTRGYNTITEWRNKDDGGVVAMSAGQSKLGYDCHELIFDDPLDEHSAYSAEARQTADDAISHYTARCQRRGKRGPVLGVASVWHPDDPHGRRRQRKAQQWSYVKHEAIIDEGLETERAFAPDVIALDELKKIREELKEQDPSERLWWAQFMGEPRLPGTDIKEPARYIDVPSWPGFRMGMGLDLSYSSGKQSDWFALAVCRFYGSQVFVQLVERVKTEMEDIEARIKAAYLRFGNMPTFSYMSGPEKGVAHYMHSTPHNIPVQVMPARWSKKIRAQNTIDRWNAGNVQFPLHAAWNVDAVILRGKGFTGLDGIGDDDEMDALVSCVDGVLGASGSMGSGPKKFGERRY